MSKNSESSSTAMVAASLRSATTNASTIGASGTSRTSTSWLLIKWSRSSTGPLKDGVVTTKVTGKLYSP